MREPPPDRGLRGVLPPALLWSVEEVPQQLKPFVQENLANAKVSA